MEDGNRQGRRAPLWVRIDGGSREQVREFMARLELHEPIPCMPEDRDSFGARTAPRHEGRLLVLPAPPGGARHAVSARFPGHALCP